MAENANGDKPGPWDLSAKPHTSIARSSWHVYFCRPCTDPRRRGDEKLWLFLDWCRQKAIKLNSDKLKLRETEAAYSRKVHTIKQMPECSSYGSVEAEIETVNMVHLSLETDSVQFVLQQKTIRRCRFSSKQWTKGGQMTRKRHQKKSVHTSHSRRSLAVKME